MKLIDIYIHNIFKLHFNYKTPLIAAITNHNVEIVKLLFTRPELNVNLMSISINIFFYEI